MASSYPPARESLLVPWSTNYDQKITASPTTYSLTPAMATAYNALHDDFVAKWNVCQVPSTKTPLAIEQKNAAKQLLIAEIRKLSRIVQNSPTTTDAMRVELGLPVPDVTPSPINPPTEKPVVEIVKVDGRTVTVRLRQPGSESRGKPAGVLGATVCSFIGATPPADIAGWKPEGESTRTDFSVAFPASVPAGTQVWITAFWKNPRLMSGPPCDPISIYLGGGVSQAA